jgi:hypothetical protein
MVLPSRTPIKPVDGLTVSETFQLICYYGALL